MSLRDLGRPAVLGEMAVVVGCLVGLVWVGFKVMEPRRSAAAVRSDEPVIASVEHATGGVRRRPNKTLAWFDLTAGESLQRRDMVFVGPGASAVVVFDDGTRLEIGSDSLIAIDRADSGAEGAEAVAEAGTEGTDGAAQPARPGARKINVRVGRGAVVATAGKSSSVALISADGKLGTAGAKGTGDTGMTLSTEGKVSVEVRDGAANVEVLEGTAVVETVRGKQELRVKEALGIQQGSVGAVESRLLTPLAPGRGRKVWYPTGPRRVTVRWKGDLPGVQVELSQNAAFASGVTRAPGSGNAYRFKAPADGLWFWRLVDAKGKPVSGRRHFFLEEDRPPVLLKPAPDEAVVAAPGEKIEFKWSPVKGVDRYVLEISSDEDFKDKPEVVRPVDDDDLKFESQLPEGRFFWRVRSSDKARGKSPWTKPRVFRLLHTPLLSAPKPVDVKLEVEDGK